MNFENAQNRFRLLSGLSEDECESWSAVLSEAADYVSGIVIKKHLTKSDEDKLGALAGVLAYCKYLVYGVESGSGFRAGELTVYADKSTFKNAEALWQNELKLNSDLISESNFVFRRVTP